MVKHIVFRSVVALVLLAALVAGAAGLGILSYNAGLARGLADSGKLVLPPAGTGPYPYIGGPFYRVGFLGPGFGLLNCLLLFLGFAFIFMLVRALVWGGLFWSRPWHRAWGGPGAPFGAHRAWEKGYPPMFEEWHRRAHGQGEPSTPPPSESNQA